MERKKIAVVEYGKLIFHSIPYHALFGTRQSSKKFFLLFDQKIKSYFLMPYLARRHPLFNRDSIAILNQQCLVFLSKIHLLKY